jgi:D-alanyl-D-alanine carboxypeptidase (penicillin-binding protein 5/6)
MRRRVGKAFAVLYLFAAVLFCSAKVAAGAEVIPARSMIIIEASAGRPLFEKNAYQKLPMASTTKIMTAIVAIEECDVKEVVTIPKQACGIEGSSIYLEEGEKLTVEQLLYGLMLRSGNDCAVALALHAGGSVEGFVKKMNEKAQAIGAYDTHFANPHGLHAYDHFITAYDLAVISSYAMKNSLFRQIVSTKRIEIPCTTRDYGRILYNKNKMLSRYEGANGIKTGFTRQAGRCLVSSAMRDGMELICVVLNCGPMWEVSEQYLDKMFGKYSLKTVLEPYKYWGDIEVAKRPGLKVGYYTKDKFAYPLCEEDEDKISIRVELPDSLTPPFNKDAEIGKVKYYFENELIFSTKIYTIDGVGALTYTDALDKIISQM